MANDQVELVKSKIDIVEVIGERVQLKKAGRHFKGLCPFHSEKSPSFIVSPERQSFKCFGCQKGGDVLTFLQDYDGYSFLEALELLAKRVGITLESYRPTSQDTYRKRLLEIMSLASEYYHYLLTEHKSGEAARAYLKGRGVTNEAIKQFKLGYAPEQWRSASDFLTKKKGYSEEEVLATGITIKSDGGRYYERYRNRVMFPLKDHKGVIVGLSGRTLGKDIKEAKYINSPETMLYSKSRMLYGLWENREAIRKEKQIVLVEGEMDMIASWQANVKNVVAIKGSAFTTEQAQLITRYCPNILMSLDADMAGKEAIKRAVQVAQTLDLSIRVVQIKDGKDPGEVATTNPRAWREMVAGAVLYWDFLIDAAMSQNDIKTGIGATAVTAELVPALTQIENAVIRAHYVGELAKKLNVPEESIYSEIERTKKKKELSQLKQTITAITEGGESRREKTENYLLALALQYYPQLLEQINEIDLKLFESQAMVKIWRHLTAYSGEWKINKLTEKLPAELLPAIDEAYLVDLSGVGDIKREWEQTRDNLKEQYVRTELKELTAKISLAEKKGESTEQLQESFARLSAILRTSVRGE